MNKKQCVARPRYKLHLITKYGNTSLIDAEVVQIFIGGNS